MLKSVAFSPQPTMEAGESNRNWFEYWREGGDDVPDELPAAVNLNEDEKDSEVAEKAVALVVDGTRRGVVALCKEVASLIKEKAELEKKLEGSQLPPIGSASLQNKHQLTVNVHDVPSMSMTSIRDIVQTSRTDLTRGKDEPALGALVKHTRDKIRDALEEICTLTTHDDNTERQYRETVRINQKLEADLDRARKELTRLRAKLSIAEMTPLQIREERARKKETEAKRQAIDKETRSERPSNERRVLPRLLSASERAQVVNAKGEYTNSRNWLNDSRGDRRARSSLKKSPDALPPPLQGCSCPVCRSVQSMGGTVTKHRRTKLGQTVLLGDRVIIKGERSGTVKYIGKLDGAPSTSASDVFLGIHLDQPIGLHNGTFQGKRYFTCPARHGAFLNVKDVVCVVNRQPQSPIKSSRVQTRGHLASLKEENERLLSADRRKKRQQMELEAELADIQARFDPEGLVTPEKKNRSFKLPYYSEAELEADIIQFKKQNRPTSSLSEDSDLALMRQKIENLMGKGKSRGKDSLTPDASPNDIDKHTVEEATRHVIELGDVKQCGTINAKDFVYLLNSAALCMNLDDGEVSLLLEKIHVPPDNMIDYRMVLPTLLAVLEAVKNEGGSATGPRDWCSVYSKTTSSSFFYNLRTGAVRLAAEKPPLTSAASLEADDAVERIIDNVLLEAFQVQDPDRSGFVHPSHFLDVLKSLNFQLTDAQTELVLAKCGRQQDPTLGVPYINHTGQIRRFIAEAIRETAAYANDVWVTVYYPRAGLFYLNKRTGDVRSSRPPGQIL
ncbi:uncharacterized protein [Oscarella lobularis]|uniref:uncharacterized protein n=1 Tax=Oscarella lobularis TaxID=121494 RepID=UPI003314045E